MNFTDSIHCKSRAHCETSRRDAKWRAQVGAPDVCPHFGLGDLVEKIAKPIAKLLRLKCHEKNGTLKPQSPCAKRRNKLNQYVPELFKP